MTQYAVAGLTKTIDLPVPLHQDIISPNQINQRPGLPRQTPGYWVQHETANEAAGADAAMHNRWLHNGGDGQQVSFHFCVDDHEIYQMIPIDEVTWQAADGGGPGNMSGISCELCVNSDGDEAKARHNAEALCGGIMAALGLGTDRVKRHWDFNAADPNRHHCPDHMMNDNYWPTFVQNVGKVITPPAPADPVPTIPWTKNDVGIVKLGTVNALAFVGSATAKRNVPVRVAADSGSKVIATLPIHSVSLARGTFRTTKNRWILIDLGKGGVGRALLSAFQEKWPVP